MGGTFYNACDYWCEECDHAAECPVCEKTHEKATSGDFVEDIKESLGEALAMLHDMAEEFHIDLAGIAGGDEEDVASRVVDADPLVTLSRDFTLKAHKSLGRMRPFVTEETREFFEDLQWHHTLVAVKTHRAMRSLYEGFTEDAVDSAQVARKSTYKCITALATLGQRCPEIGEECASLRRTTETIRAELDRVIETREPLLTSCTCQKKFAALPE
jgi:hypothetical protein